MKQKGSGLIQYPWKKPGTGNEVDSIGYAFAINNWNWIMVKGVFLDDVQQTIATKKAQLKHKQRQDIFYHQYDLHGHCRITHVRMGGHPPDAVGHPGIL